MWDSRNLVLPFLYSPAQHVWKPTQFTQVTLTAEGEPVARNTTQRGAFTKLEVTTEGQLNGTYPFQEQGGWYTVDRAAQGLRGINDQPIFRERIFLFNVVISLEWMPSARIQQQIRIAAKKASDFLYDVTDGYMAIGQVIIGGPELLDASDIQVLASNRLYPRSWVDALHKPEKFQPIRLGRGTWQKNRGILLTWDTPEGYRAVVHEWGHYAFGLADRYLRKRKYARANATQYVWDDTKSGNTVIAVAVPEIALPVETIMANQEISEFADIDQIFERINERFKVKITRSDTLEGPDELPLPLPIFPQLKAAVTSPDLASVPPSNDAGEEIVLPVEEFIDLVRSDPAVQQLAQTNIAAEPLNVDMSDPSRARSHWLYVLKQPFIDDDIPTGIIAQGKLSDDDKANGFTLLGAKLGDRVAIVSEVGGYGRVHCGTLEMISNNGKSSPGVRQWLPVTPTDGTQPIVDRPFFVDVIPKSLGNVQWTQTPPLVEIAVSVAAADLPDDIYIYTSGQTNPINMNWSKPAAGTTTGAPVMSAYKSVQHLDGHVFLRWRGKRGAQGKLFISSYSQGGGPSTTGGGKPSITAGSSEGNAMLFFLGPDALDATEEDTVPDDNPKVRIVTSVLPALRPLPSDAGIESRSYIFSLASNEPLSEYRATLVLYYDYGAPKHGGELYIHRWDESNTTWQRLTTIAPTDLAYIALPITQELETAPGLMRDTGTRVERYRICWKRR